jgi:integrase
MRVTWVKEKSYPQIPKPLPTNMLKPKEVMEAKPKTRQYKMADDGGLCLVVSPAGGKSWWYRYRYEGKEKTLVIGQYPQISLDAARVAHGEAKKLLAVGIDPQASKQAAKEAKAQAGANTFELIAREWHQTRKGSLSPTSHLQCMQRLERWAFPAIGRLPITMISTPVLLKFLRGVLGSDGERRRETVQRLKTYSSQIFRYAVQTGRAEVNPALNLTGALPTPKVKHLQAATDPERLGEILRLMDTYPLRTAHSHSVKAALLLSPLLFVRPGELVRMRWEQIDFNKCQWSFTTSKTNTNHITPLCRQAIAILQQQQRESKSPEGWVFPGLRGSEKHMAEVAVQNALKTLGIEDQTAHGFRAVARTLLDEVLEFPVHIIEQQLAHAVRDALGRAYNRTAHLPQRVEMMQAWADYLDSLRGVTPGTGKVTKSRPLPTSDDEWFYFYAEDPAGCLIAHPNPIEITGKLPLWDEVIQQWREHGGEATLSLREWCDWCEEEFKLQNQPEPDWD